MLLAVYIFAGCGAAFFIGVLITANIRYRRYLKSLSPKARLREMEKEKLFMQQW